ncbi:MAG: M48 family metalloprotease [Cellvibrionaceae bacterium]
MLLIKSSLLRPYALLLLPLLTLISPISASNELPSIGGGTSISTAQEEKRLGQTWLRLYRRQVPVSSDPILIEYTEALLNRIAEHNPAAGKEFSLVIARNRTLNAFAVPGGIIGVHTGLFQHAQTEDQFASVLAHELAHLSQRHYARGVEKQKGQQLVGMAAILASLIIAATNGEAGLAAIQATQAGIIDQQLRFSRLYEQEADRIGMTTLVNAGFDPHSMSDMFEQMQRASQFYTEPPEFLLTHPVTAKRIADAENRARNYPNQNAPSSLAYDLARARVLFFQEETPQQAISRFESELRGFSPSEEGSRYGLVLSLTANKEFEKADKVLQPLLERYPDQAALLIAKSNIDAGNNKLGTAIENMQAAISNKPGSYALNIHYSRLLAKNNDHINSARILNELREARPDDPFIWYHLAEIAGLAGDILTLHKARAEYFILYGNFDNAENQLNNLLKKFSDNKTEVAIAKQRLEDVKKLKKNAKL